MPKLLVVAAGYPTANSFAGAFHRDQLRLIAAAGFDVTVVVPTPWVPRALAAMRPRWRGYAEAPVRQTDGAIEILRPRYPTIPGETRWFFPDIAQYSALRTLRLPRPDIVQAFYGFPPGAAARRLARRWNVPYLVGLLGDDVNLLPSQRERNRRALCAVVRDAAVAFANGPTLAAEASRITGTPVANLPIGVDAGRFAGLPPREMVRAKLGLPAGKIVALYVGSLLPAKGSGELIAALPQLRDSGIVAVAVGDGPLRARFCGEPNAIWLGIRPPQDVVLAMAAADFLVHPSYSEGLPIAVLEAAFASLPIVTTNARGCIDLARDGRALIVPVGDADALARAMAEAARDRAGMKRRSEVMLAHVREHYSLAANTQRLISLYRDCLAAGRAAQS